MLETVCPVLLLLLTGLPALVFPRGNGLGPIWSTVSTIKGGASPPEPA